MNTRLLVDEKEGLKESQEESVSRSNASIRLIAKVMSLIFHPVFVPVFLIIYMVYLHPYIFSGFTPFDKFRAVMMGVMMYCFFPLVTVILLKALKFIESIQLETGKDRVIPLVACGIWYFWIWYVWRNLPEYPGAAVKLSLGIWISVSIALLANIIMKVSLHAISMGVMLVFIFALAFSQNINMGVVLSVATLIAGLVCSSRFIVSNHTTSEVYGGLAIGMGSMLIGQLLG
jgi:hypothetical protein